MVTAELLKKYIDGKCTAEETRMVESWLSSGDDDAILSDEEIGNSPEKIRARLYASLFSTESGTPVIPLYKKLIRYAAVACLVLVSYGAGYFSKPQNTIAETAVASAETKGHLIIYHNHGKTTKIPSGRYDLRFEGSLKLYNGSDDPMVVFCGAKTLLLEPWETYYLNGSDENHSLDSGKHIANHDDFAQNLSGDFTVLVVAA